MDADLSLGFFQELMVTIPNQYKQIAQFDTEMDEQPKKKNKNKNNQQKGAPLSMIELKERA